MSEKEREMEAEEKLILQHFSHEHPLTLIETRPGDFCCGCYMYFNGAVAYGCSKKCGYDELLHEECAEMPREIRHPMHPQHILGQNICPRGIACSVCERYVPGPGYSCAFPSCVFRIHVGCVPSTCVIEAEQKESINHPSHPHELRLLRSKRSCSFKCDACGTTEKGNSYICSICQYWIHESCATLLPTVELRENLHHHSLSLAFHLPKLYTKYEYNCDICRKTLLFKYWVYHCEICRYVVHIKCAINTSPAATASSNSINDANTADDKDIVPFPINDVSEELNMVIPHDNEIINGKYEFHSHHHQLSLISSEEKNDDDDDDDLHHKQGSELICDGCTSPIYHKKKQNSSSSSHKFCYYSCGECKYFLHFACFHLPIQLPSHPLHQNCDKKLTLRTCPELKFEGFYCTICYLYTNGLFYDCTECAFRVDVKCASLPNTIKHAAHPQHLHYLKLVIESLTGRQGRCGACGFPVDADYNKFYRCGSCECSLHVECVLLPAANQHRWDKLHPLPLTYDANINYPGDFYCDFCEKKMNPKKWMYHCRQCDLSFHPDCLPATSGWYRNMKFGDQYVIAACHPHPVTYELITTKQRCDLCHLICYGEAGFQCASCNFIMCLYPCGSHEKDKNAIQAIH